MNLLARSDFEEEKCREHKHKKEHTVFNGALDVSIRVQDRQKLRAEKGFRKGLGREPFVPITAFPRLRIIATVIGNFPLRVKTIRAHRTLGRQKRTAKCRIRPVRFHGRLVLNAEWCEVNSFAAVKSEGNSKFHRGADRFVASERRRPASCI